MQIACCAALGVPTILARLPEWRKFLDRSRLSGAIKSLARNLSESPPDWIIPSTLIELKITILGFVDPDASKSTLLGLPRLETTSSRPGPKGP